MTRYATLSFLLLTACGKKTAPTPPAPPAQAAAPVDVVWEAGLEEGSLRVTLLEAGAPPQASLRYTPAVGDQGQLRLTMDMDMAADMGGMLIPMDLPAVIMDMGVSVTSIAPSGDIAFTTEIVAADVAPSALPEPLVAQLREGMASVIGLTGATTLSSQGVVLDTHYNTTNPAPTVAQQVDQLNQSTQNLSMPLPSEPVGVGAQWEVIRRNQSNGADVAERTVITLAARDGDTVTLRTSTTQRLVDNNISLPDQPGTQATITYFTSSGTGEQVTQLSSMIPVQGHTEMEMEMNMAMTAEGETMEMGTDMTMAIDFTRL